MGIFINYLRFLLHLTWARLVFTEDFEAVPKEGRPPTEAELQQFFLPYRGYCARKGVSHQQIDCYDHLL